VRQSLLKTLEHGVKRSFFTLSRIYLKKGRDGFETIDPAKIGKVLFIRPEKLGDMVISLPVFHNLKRLYPHLQLYTISSPRNIAIIRDNKNINDNFLYTKNTFHDFAMVRKVRRLGVDVVVDMVCDDSVTSLFLTQYSSPRAWRIGLGKTRHKKYYDFNYRYRTGDEAHVLDNTLKLLTAFGIDTEKAETFIPPSIDEKRFQKADDFFASLNGHFPGGVIGLNISAGQPTRVWPLEKNKQLLERLIDSYPRCRFVISSDPSERDRAIDLAGRFESRVDPLPAKLDLLEVSAIISRMNILITPDTSLVHIARSFKVPVVGLYTRFGKNFELWRPYKQKSGAVISGNDYNIFDIEVDDVCLAVSQLLPPGDIS
jgi:ADP-heptose:LPS heptosyltransferase